MGRKGFVVGREGSELETSRDATSQKRNGTKTTSGSERNPETPGKEKR